MYNDYYECCNINVCLCVGVCGDVFGDRCETKWKTKALEHET